MNNKERSAMQQALEALENYGIDGTKSVGGIKCTAAITALREALAGVNMSPTEQAEQEPVAWMDDKGFVRLYKDSVYKIPLYAATVHTKDLTDVEIADIVYEMNGNEPTAPFWRDLARAVIAADREKNK